MNDMEKDIVTRLREFMDNEAKSYSMDFGCITPEYVYRMWGGSVKLEEIEKGLRIIQSEDNPNKKCVDLKELFDKVEGLKADQKVIEKKAFQDFIIKLEEEGSLKDGLLDLSKIDEDERVEFYRLVEKFDRDFCDIMMQSVQ